MALFTKLFQRSHDPYELGGRWYRFHIVNDALLNDQDAQQTGAHISRASLADYIVFDVKTIPLFGCIVPMVDASAEYGLSLNNLAGTNSATSIIYRLKSMGCMMTGTNRGAIGILQTGLCSDYYVYAYIVKR